MGNSESTQTQTRSSNSVARGGSNGQIISNNANAVATRGDAKAYIFEGVGVLAMARGPEGQAAAYTDGYTTGILTSGNGQAGVDGGLAWAKVGIDNVAAAFSGTAHYTSQRALEGCCPCSGRAAVDECRCRCHR